MIKEILEPLKLFQVVEEKEIGPAHVAFGHPKDLKEWLVFVRLILTQQPGEQCTISRVYGLQGGKLASVWRIDVRDTKVLNEIARGYLSKPEWLKNFRSTQKDGVTIMTLIGDDLKLPPSADPKRFGFGSGGI